MKYLALLTLSLMLISCSIQGRKTASDDHLTEQERKEQLREFGSEYRN